MQRDGQLAGWHRLALHSIGVVKRLTDKGNASFDGLAGTADFLNLQLAQPTCKLLLLHQPADLVHLAA